METVSKNYETFGDYILLEKLAAGGMAEIYLAKKMASSGIQKFVAIKRILQQFSSSKDFINMFKEEAKIAINLSHSNVVPIYDFGVENSQLYIAMEFVEGRNLRQILNRMKKQKKQFTIAQTVYIIKQACSGLDYAHNCIDPTTGKNLDIIHRDVSPQNIMISFEGDAKIVDFGIAKASHQIEATQAGTLKGKFGYMSPEQIEGHPLDPRTDIFAMGIILWEVLANKRLFLANNEINTLRKIRECQIPKLRDINPSIPLDLEKTVEKALKKDKLERYKTAFDMHKDLQSFLSRFEPDFSSKDISSFVKGLFSEEIIEIRKKQVAYAKIKFKPKKSSRTRNKEQTSSITLTHTKSKTGKTVIDKEKLAKELEVTTKTKSLQQNIQRDSQWKIQTIEGSRNHLYNSSSHYSLENENTSTSFRPHSSSRIKQLRKRNSINLVTFLFSISFILVFLAYINKFHPLAKENFCRSSKICPSFIYNKKEPFTKNLKIKTFPRGAKIFINDKEVGVSPKEIVIDNLPVNLKIRKKGYSSEETVIRKISSEGLNYELVSVDNSFLKVDSVGVNIFINGERVKPGQKVPVPANQKINIKLVNPLTKHEKERSVSVRKNQVKSLFISPPSY